MPNPDHLTESDAAGICSEVLGQHVNVNLVRDETRRRPPDMWLVSTDFWRREGDVFVRRRMYLWLDTELSEDQLRDAMDPMLDWIRSEAMNRQFTTCKSCHRRIWWAVTNADKSMPMDPDPNPEGGWIVDGQTEQGAPRIRKHEPLLDAGLDRFHPHWATCPNADEHRKQKR